MANYGKIKQMSIGEMAKDRCNRLPLDVIATVPCSVLTREWLEMEVER